MEPHAAIDGTSETITPRAINGILTEKKEGEEPKRAPEITRCKGQHKKCHIERYQSRDRNQESNQELVRGAAIFKAVACKLVKPLLQAGTTPNGSASSQQPASAMELQAGDLTAHEAGRAGTESGPVKTFQHFRDLAWAARYAI